MIKQLAVGFWLRWSRMSTCRRDTLLGLGWLVGGLPLGLATLMVHPVFVVALLALLGVCGS
jgi:hypothetical protein